MSSKYKFSFSVTEITGQYGNKYPLLTANEYPWMNCQVITTPPDRKDEIMAELKKREEYVVYAKYRTDFCVIQAGGGTPEHPTIEITENNWEEVDKALCDCMQAAADFWAKHHPTAE